ncbi:hypothetical protein SLAVM298S_07583 [Streptomyces lavendulae subsp. lavendulae]
MLVHGGFVDGSGWQGVYDHLTADGYRVAVVQNPTLSLAGDVAATRQVLDGLDGQAVLVGHSYGGVVVTEAGAHPNVAALAYIAAFAPDEGESVSTLIADPPPGAPVPPILPPQDGFLFLDRDRFAASFAADVPEKTAAFMADSQVPWGVEALEGAVSAGLADQAVLVPGRHRRPHDPAARPARHVRPGEGRRHRDPRQPRRLRLPPGRRGGRHRPGRPGGGRPGVGRPPHQDVSPGQAPGETRSRCRPPGRSHTMGSAPTRRQVLATGAAQRAGYPTAAEATD